MVFLLGLRDNAVCISRLDLTMLVSTRTGIQWIESGEEMNEKVVLLPLALQLKNHKIVN